MLKKIKSLKTVIIVVATTLVASAAMIAPAAASCTNNVTTGIESGVAAATGAKGTCDNGTGSNSTVSGGIERLAKKAVNIFSIIVGIIAVIMIVYGGFRYITSGGDSGKVGNAKNTLLYAIVGLVIVALAQLIVHYVLNESNSISGSGTTPAGSLYSTQQRL